MKLKTALITGAASVALLASSGAVAGEYYIGVFGGLATFDDELTASVSGLYTSTVYHSKVSAHTHFYTVDYYAALEDDFENGWVFGVAVGRELAPQVRGELEIAYRGFDVDGGANVDAGALFNTSKVKYSSVKYSSQQTVNTSFAADTSGDVTIWSFMANVWYDIDMGHSAITPFVGGGIGLAQMSLDYSVNVAGTFTTKYSGTFYASISTSLGDDDWAFAYQFGGGVAYELGNGGTISAQYRYFGTTDAEFGDLELSAESHNFMIGLSFPIN